jgi:NAD(P)-dependent dehydrogenase (short-subunit alcohol dehydrogenase family)
MMRLRGKAVILTGAAGGIGSAIFRSLIGEGASVLATDLNQENIERITAETTQNGGKAIGMAGNIADRADVKKIVQRALDAYGRIDGLVNNASASRNVTLADATDDDLALALNTNLWATFFLMQECYPHLKQTKGSVVNFGSGAAINGQPRNGTYAAAKEAVRGLTRTAVREWGPDGIRINIVLPFAASAAMTAWGKANPDLYEKSIESVSLKRAGDPDTDIAPVVVWLLSDESKYVTGQTIAVDGGQVVLP